MDVKRLFELHPDKTEVHQTSDGHLFWEKSFAEGHASGLKDKSVSTIQKDTDPVDVETEEV